MVRRGSIIDGRFKIEGQIGAGGMGTVYRAWDQLTNRPVAFKVLIDQDASNEERFEREARVLAEFKHPGIVRYIAHGRMQDGARFLVMEWVEGESLADRVEQQGLTVAESVLVVQRTAEALAEAHARGIVHRDIKTSNLLLLDGDLTKLKLIDFGIARRMREVHKLTATGVMLGSPGYAAPEQARAARDIDARADVFALGCVLYECLTGSAAFSGEHLLAKLAKVLLGDPPSVRALCPEITPQIEMLVERMLAKDVSFRPKDGGEVARSLAALTDLPPSPRRPRRHQDEPTRAIHRGTTEEAAAPHEGDRFVCLVLAASVDEAADGGMQTMTLDEKARSEEELQGAVSKFGARLELLADGSVVAVLEGGGSPVEQASRAARCALVMRKLLPHLQLMITAESVAGSGSEAIADLIDRGVRALRADALQAIFAEYRQDGAPDDGVRLDALSARMLAALPFEVRHGKSGHFLVAEANGKVA